jgi:general secretion pathway protein M
MMKDLARRWHGYAPRERWLLIGGGLALSAALLFALVIDPLLDRHDRAERQWHRKQRDLTELAAVAGEYAAKRARLTSLEARMPTQDGNFSVLALLEEAINVAQVRDHIVSMQPQTPQLIQGYEETAVDLHVDGVELPQLLNLLTLIEQAPYDVQVRHLKIRTKFDNPHHLDATLRVLSYAKPG